MNFLDIVFRIVAFLWFCSFIAEVVCLAKQNEYYYYLNITTLTLVVILNILAIIDVCIK